MDAIYVAATGLKAGQEQVDLISNNLSNLNTPAFKKAYANFVEVVSAGVGAQQASTGAGTKLGTAAHLFTPGDLKPTSGMLDVGINGIGFFEILLPSGEVAYTRNGRLSVDEDGSLVSSQGYPLAGNIMIPADAVEVRITRDGIVMARSSDDAEFYEAGFIELANFISTDGLEAQGQGIFKNNNPDNPIYYARPGSEGLGEIQQGALETSNVELVNELLEMMVAQRIYQANGQVIRQVDQMMQISNSLADG